MTKLIRRAIVVAVIGTLGACSSSSHPTATRPLPTTTATTTATTSATTTTTLPPATTSLAAKSDAYVYSLKFGGRPRGYRLHVPPQAAGAKKLPLVLNLHGSTQNGLIQELQTGMDASSDRHGYLVAYPDGTRITKVLTPDPVAKDRQYGWNAGYCCDDPSKNHVDDVGFLSAVISNIASHTPVDLHRVYVTGMSSGGMMAYALAAQAAPHIAAMASVEGEVVMPDIKPGRPVPVLEFHSVDDPIVHWDPDPKAPARLRFSPLAGIEQWVKVDGCDTTPHTDPTIRGTGTNAGLTATLVTYRGCKPGTEVALWRFTGSGHVWPGAPFNTGPRDTWILDGVGRGTTLVDANEAMWQFFQRFASP